MFTIFIVNLFDKFVQLALFDENSNKLSNCGLIFLEIILL